MCTIITALYKKKKKKGTDWLRTCPKSHSEYVEETEESNSMWLTTMLYCFSKNQPGTWS